MKIPQNSLQIQAYNYIKEAILTGKLDNETMYSETKLAKEIGISRTPMREALQCLSQDGYITIIPSKGFVIRQLNENDMREIIQIRCAIEGFATHIIAKEINTPKAKKLLTELEYYLNGQIEAQNRDDNYSAFISYDHHFHTALINYLDNKEFDSLFQSSMYLIQLTTQSALSIEGRVADTLKEHTNFFNALKAGDGDLAYNTLMDHLTMPLNVVHCANEN